MDKEKRQGYLSAIEMYFTTILDYKIVERVKRGFYYLQKGERKSVYTEVGLCSHSTSCKTVAIPWSYKTKPFSLGVANTNYYSAIFPEAKLICVGRPKKLRLFVATNPTSVDYFTDDDGVEWVWLKRKTLDEAFDKVEVLE